LGFLCEYDFDIKHIKGKENKVVNELRIKVHHLHTSAIIMYRIDNKDRILEATNAYFQYRDLVAKLQQSERPQKEENYTLEAEGILMYKSRVYIPNVQGFKLAILR
jgi:hypothetical protein